ncbi:hypothetical protein [Myroides odoratus]|uniref:hypothetical protein n=1 Tax=Myroides odoratus TaxID=256 RepID=UPI0018D247C4|nr:hypothetical protein [Myroides odoratus]
MMKNIKYKPSVLVSLFIRKGGEGLFTKILSTNESLALSLVKLLKEDEKALILFKQHEVNLLLITDSRLIMNRGTALVAIEFFDIIEVRIALEEEFKERILKKEEFTRLLVKVKSGIDYIIQVEKGKPFQGLYQVLSYISTVNRE